VIGSQADVWNRNFASVDLPAEHSRAINRWRIPTLMTAEKIADAMLAGA
jgi:hypothetical protein